MIAFNKILKPFLNEGTKDRFSFFLVALVLTFGFMTVDTAKSKSYRQHQDESFHAICMYQLCLCNGEPPKFEIGKKAFYAPWHPLVEDFSILREDSP